MSKLDPSAADITRLQSAGEWVQRLNEPDADLLGDQWMQWCRTDPKNLPAFEQMQRLWNGFAAAPLQNAVSPQSPTPERRAGRNGLMALAASVMVLIGIAAWVTLRYSSVQVQSTRVGEQRHIGLADGSTLDLAPNSSISTRFTLARREVWLLRGQAFFEVAHSTLRPFIVHANNLTATAVGTAFDVRVGPISTVVTVSEGRVNVAPDGASGTTAGTVRAAAGQQVSLSKFARKPSVASVDPKVAGSWRNGTLRFVGEPLEDVVGAINRYTAREIVVAPAFQQTRFTGTVSPPIVGDWLKALEQIYGVEIIDQGNKGILIQSRDHAGAAR